MGKVSIEVISKAIHDDFDGLRWVTLAIAGKGDEHLKRMLVKDGKTIGTDGNRLHIYTLRDAILNEGLYNVVKSSTKEIQLQIDDSVKVDSYPNYKAVIPKKMKKPFEIINEHSGLADLLRNMDDDLCLNLYYYEDLVSIIPIVRDRYEKGFKLSTKGKYPIKLTGKGILGLVMPMNK